MPVVKGSSKALPEVLDMIKCHGSTTTKLVMVYFDIDEHAARKRLERLKKAGLIESVRSGLKVIWRLRESDTQVS